MSVFGPIFIFLAIFGEKRLNQCLDMHQISPKLTFPRCHDCFKEKTSWATRIYSWIQYIRCTAEKSGNPEKNQIFVKKKSHSHKNALNQKSMCAKLLLHIKKNCTQGFCHILSHYGVTFFWQWFFTKTSEFYRYFNRVSNSEKIKFKILYFWCLLLLTYPSKVLKTRNDIWEYYQNG